MFPLNIVEKEGFKRMSKVFDLRYQLPSQNYFSRTTIPALYAEVHEMWLRICIKLTFTLLQQTYCGVEPYISLTVHYVDGRWKLQSKCLQTHMFMPAGPHRNQDSQCFTRNSGVMETTCNWRATGVYDWWQWMQCHQGSSRNRVG